MSRKKYSADTSDEFANLMAILSGMMIFFAVSGMKEKMVMMKKLREKSNTAQD